MVDKGDTYTITSPVRSPIRLRRSNEPRIRVRVRALRIWIIPSSAASISTNDRTTTISSSIPAAVPTRRRLYIDIMPLPILSDQHWLPRLRRPRHRLPERHVLFILCLLLFRALGAARFPLFVCRRCQFVFPAAAYALDIVATA